MPSLSVPTKASLSLIASLEDRSYHSRWEVLRPLRIAYDSDPSVQALVGDLASSTDFTCRLLAASIAGGSRGPSVPSSTSPSSSATAALLQKLLTDSDDRVAARAMTGALSNMSVTAIADLAPQLTPVRLSRCCFTLLRLGRGADIDAVYRMLAPLPIDGSTEGSKRISVAQQQRLLAHASLDIWNALPSRAAWLGPICAASDATNARCWGAVCDRFPEWAAKRMGEELRDVGASRVQLPQPLTQQVLSTLSSLAGASDVRSIEAGLELLNTALDKMAVPEYVLARFRSKRPREVVFMLKEKGLLTENSLSFSRRTWRRIRNSAPEMLEDLAKGNYIRGVRAPSIIPETLPVKVRQAIFAFHRQRFVCANGTIASAVLFTSAAGLDARSESGEQYFNFKLLESEPHTRIPYLSLLPFSKAIELATAASYVMNNDVAIRTVLATNLIKGTRLYPEHITDVLKYGLKRSKEQDPWRAAFFEGLLQHVPPSRWCPDEHFGLLEELMSAALAAKDLSHSTMSNIIALLFRLSLVHTTFAVKHVSFWMEKSGGYGSNNQCKKWICKNNAPALWECFESYARVKIGENSPSHVATAVNYFDSVNLRYLGEKPKQLLVDTLNMESVFGFITAIPLLLNYYRRFTISEIIPAALISDPDCILDTTVRDVLSREIQGPHLRSAILCYSQAEGAKNKNLLKGRFGAHFATQAGTRAPLVFTGSVRFRWPSSLQQLYGEVILSFLEKEDQPIHVCRGYFEYLRDLPGFCPAHDSLLLRFARLEAKPENEAKRDFALHTLGHMHDEESLRELSAATKDEKRVRTAHLGMKRRMRSMCPSEALARIQAMSDCKLVTVQKELVRMIGSIGTPEAFSALNEWAERPDLHIHTRLALLKSYFSFLDDAKVWDRLIAAAGPAESKPDTVVELCSTPDTVLLFPWQLEKYKMLLLNLLKYPHGQVTYAALRRVQTAWATADDLSVFDAVVPFLECSDQQHISNAAFAALIGMSVPSTTLIERAATLHHASALQSFVDALAAKTLCAIHLAERQHTAMLSVMLTEALTNSRRQIALCAKLLTLAIPTSWGAAIERWERSGLVHPGVAAALIASVDSAALERWEMPHWAEAELSMRKSSLAIIRRMGLSLLVRLGGRLGWDAPKRAALTVYQADADSWVSDSALLVKLPLLVS